MPEPLAKTLELKVGRCYRAKKPAVAGYLYLNDRQILYISPSGGLVQYDGPSVGNGRKYPTVKREAFEKWASHDVTDELPDGGWLDYSKWQERRKVKR